MSPNDIPPADLIKRTRHVLRALQIDAPHFPFQPLHESFQSCLDALSGPAILAQKERKKKTTSLAEMAFATGCSRTALAVVRKLDAANVDTPTRQACTFALPFERWAPQDLPTAVGLWAALFRGIPDLPQASWFATMRDAVSKHRPDVVAWIAGQNGFWGNDANQALDALETMSRIACIHHPTREAVLHAFRVGWMRAEGADPRKRHVAVLWIMGCIRLGWVAPHHSRAEPFPEVIEGTTTAHGALRFRTAMGAWEDWVGLEEAEAKKRIKAMAHR